MHHLDGATCQSERHGPHGSLPAPIEKIIEARERVFSHVVGLEGRIGSVFGFGRRSLFLRRCRLGLGGRRLRSDAEGATQGGRCAPSRRAEQHLREKCEFEK